MKKGIAVEEILIWCIEEVNTSYFVAVIFMLSLKNTCSFFHMHQVKSILFPVAARDKDRDTQTSSTLLTDSLVDILYLTASWERWLLYLSSQALSTLRVLVRTK